MTSEKIHRAERTAQKKYNNDEREDNNKIDKGRNSNVQYYVDISDCVTN